MAPRPLAVLVLATVPLVACTCPPVQVDYGSPAATLDTWQSHLCHDDIEGEYRCLSSGLRERMLGFETYFAARRFLFEEEPILGWLLERAELDDWRVGGDEPPAGELAALTYELRGRRYTIAFVLETIIIAERAGDRPPLVGRASGALERLVGHAGPRQWIEVGSPRLVTDDDIVSVRLEERWLIDDLAGLAPVEGTLP